MPLSGAIGAGGIAGGLLTIFGGGLLSPSVPPVTQPVVDTGDVFSAWPGDESGALDEAAPPVCTWANGSATYESNMCSAFALSRLSSSVSARAIDRALRCAAEAETDCVLSPEIGVALPAAFLYDEDAGVRMLVAPRMLSHESGVARVRVYDPAGGAGRVLELNKSVYVEYLPGGSRAPVSEVLNGSDAYCVQMLRAVFVEDCWANLD
ncbi:MAG: hypothetical protein CMI16_09610 [Opitutaceae bacterium]|nr:hypothetical protein [Opitutaceae bacterium]